MIAVVALAGCNQSSMAAVVSPTPRPSPSVATAPKPAVDFSCRLPVVTNSQGEVSTNYQGGFIQFPQGTLTFDRNGFMVGRADDVVTVASPVLAGNGEVPFYDRALNRWIPARANQSLPDGSQYAYVTYDRNTGAFTAHVTTVASGASRAFPLNTLSSPVVTDFTAAGVYLAGLGGIGGPGEHVWLLDPRNGSIKELGSVHRVWTARDGHAWVARLDPRDTTKWPAMEIAPADSLVRIDLATGAETVWYYQAGRYPWLVGLDSSNRPVVVLGSEAGVNEFRLVDKPGSEGQVVFRGNMSGLGYFQGDHGRLWFGRYDGIYLYTPAEGFRKVFDYGGNVDANSGIQPAGFCQ